MGRDAAGCKIVLSASRDWNCTWLHRFLFSKYVFIIISKANVLHVCVKRFSSTLSDEVIRHICAVLRYSKLLESKLVTITATYITLKEGAYLNRLIHFRVIWRITQQQLNNYILYINLKFFEERIPHPYQYTQPQTAVHPNLNEAVH